MIVARTIAEFLSARAALTGSVGFTPTMGALHQGHLSLIARSRAENDRAIVSVFVNPAQFAAGEDYEKYPRKEAADIVICEAAGVDILFMPEAAEIYGEDEPRVIAPPFLSNVYEGAIRKGHFDGVLTIVLKLFSLVRPTKAYFGKKDAQQLIIIQKMARDFYINLEIAPCETIRENNALAMSSRNAYLSESERIDALKISRSLYEASKLIVKGVYNAEIIIDEMRKILDPLAVDYVAIVDRNLRELKVIEIDNTIILIAAKAGNTRLIDNLWI
ncbi:MAG: pantoate--beta-alanine ligase [Helicobacteraceae bacterium]|jgi:pantoate--beta-alanine ligase|nr:pantoate--beta-alanine ligase [Helicobacteraceae bacterium]